ncbi:uncharacterized protein LOC133913340 [Phragmites australis]|uniref:uncharacterized protein LOC133913340 n=1 Tax=Phragmites australis TaxID=29695 RepID=UPI002D79BB55|nr:uncharacterized protein LOC133913340 [Phragmites australis]
MDPPPLWRPASKRQVWRQRSAAAASATGAGADVLAWERGSTAPENAPAAASSSRRRNRRRRRRRRRDRAAEAEEASRSPEAPGSGVVSTKGDSALQAGCCSEAVEAHLNVNLPQTTTKKAMSSNKTRRNVQVGNKVIKDSVEDGAASSSLARENSVREIEAFRSKFFKKSDVRCLRNNCTASGNADTNMDYQNKNPKCPEMKNTDMSENSEEVYQKIISPDCSSLHESEEYKGNVTGASLISSNLKEEEKERKKRRGGKRRNRHKKTTSHDSPLPTGTDNSGLMTMVSENNTSRLKPKVSMTNSVSVDNAKTTEGENVTLDSAVEKRREVGRDNLDCTSTERIELQEQDTACLSKYHNVNCLSPSSLAEAYMEKPKIAFSLRQSFRWLPKKKLLILDLNGLLADINQDYHNAHMADAKVRGKLVFRRPYCDDFLNFCARNFKLGIWSSRKKENVASVVNIIMREFKSHLLFCWDMSKCTFTGYKTLENNHKPLVLKELRKLWDKEEPDLPWEEGDYSPSNTVLVDDSPYKALRNPPHTAIFPHPYSYLNCNDNSLGPGGDLRVYLQNLAAADDVECYVRNNPFGQPFITESDARWSFYAQIADKGSSPLTTCA